MCRAVEFHSVSTQTNIMESTIARRGRFDTALVNADRGVLHIVAHDAEKIPAANTTSHPHGPQHFPQTPPYSHQNPVGRASMPSQSTHIPEELYEYIITTKGEDQSTSARVCELIEKGREVEQ